MGNLLFSPNGRINSAEFMKGAIILTVLGGLLSLPGNMGMEGIGTVLGALTLLLAFPWVVIWIKRYHDGGKSGWMCLIPIIVYGILLMVVMGVLLGGEFSQMMEMMRSGASEGEIDAFTEGMLKGKGVPMTIAGMVTSLVVAFLFNAMIKRDDHENQFGLAS
jgi:uncharacterized membrane protein YhaH (DUF805 family)